MRLIAYLKDLKEVIVVDFTLRVGASASHDDAPQQHTVSSASDFQLGPV
jgi:hypothetical protein